MKISETEQCDKDKGAVSKSFSEGPITHLFASFLFVALRP